jgi:hypothetical protein
MLGSPGSRARSIAPASTPTADAGSYQICRTNFAFAISSSFNSVVTFSPNCQETPSSQFSVSMVRVRMSTDSVLEASVGEPPVIRKK